MNVEKLKKRIVTELKKHVDVAVIGLSGGADSLLCTLLSIDALGKDNVYTFSLPFSDLDLKTFNRKSVMYAEHLGIRHQVVEIGGISRKIHEAVAIGCVLEDGGKLSDLNAGNARARSRMAVLYGIAHHLNETLKKRVRVIGTGNLSEDFIGYDTKGGDALADIFPIGGLFKSEVYQVLEHYRDSGIIEEEMINRKPSAGLWENQTDEDEIGYAYNDMEPSIRKFLAASKDPDISELTGIDRFVWERHLSNKHKHEAPPVIEVRNKQGGLLDD